MLVSDKYRFILATPTKCGTYSWEAICKQVDRDVLDKIRPGLHRMVVPGAYEDFERFIVVRNPYSRLVSMYHYFLDPMNYSQWGAKFVQGREHRNAKFDHPPMTFAQFVKFMKHERDKRPDGYLGSNTFRSPDLWLNSLSENADLLGYDGYIKIEDADDEINKKLGGAIPPPGHKHRTRSRKESGKKLPSYFTGKRVRQMVEEWAAEDCQRFGYERIG